MTQSDNLRLLRSKSSSPYSPEPPKRSLVVQCLFRAAGMMNRTGYSSPHLCGGSDSEKVEWEYNQGNALLEAFAPHLSLDLVADKDVLDVGCGWGGKMIYLAKHSRLKSISGFDIPGVFEPSVAASFAHSLYISNCRFTTGFAESIPYPDNSFDILLMEDVLEHVNDPERTISECLRVLRPGGRIAVKFPSIKMAEAHHLDRAMSLPGVHYLLSFKTLAGGLNYLLLPPSKASFEPFDEVLNTKYSNAITRNLNGCTFQDFVRIVGSSGFTTIALELIPRQFSSSWLKAAYTLAYKVPKFREFLSSYILFVGEKSAIPPSLQS